MNIVTLRLLRNELVDDIKQYAFVEADIMDNKDNHAQHQTFDIAEDGNVDRVNRVLSLAYSECVEFLYPFSKVAIEESENRDDTLTQDNIFEIVLNVPETLSKSTCDLMIKYIHEYMVCRVLSDWFSITKPDASQNWMIKAEISKEGILSTKARRIKKVRRGMSIF